MTTKIISPSCGIETCKIAVGGAVLLGLGAATMAYAKNDSLPTVEKVELDRYLGTWYEEVARKPLTFQNKCDRDVTATYTLNENGNVNVDNRCIQKNGQVTQSVGEAYIQNAPYNTKLKSKFLTRVYSLVASGPWRLLGIETG